MRNIRQTPAAQRLIAHASRWAAATNLEADRAERHNLGKNWGVV